MADCILLGKHTVTIEHDTEDGFQDMLIKSSDVEVRFLLDESGNLNVTFMSDNTVGADLMKVIPVPKKGG